MAASNSPAEKLITDNIDIWTSAIKKRGSQGRGSSNKTELYGIKKLRELILELAVRGLLVPQDPNDEPTSVLLEKIAAEKEQLIKDGKIKKQKAFPEISEDEKPFELPRGWQHVRWSNIAYWAIGSGFPTIEQGKYNEEILFAKVSDMNLKGNEKYIKTTVNSISLSTANRIKAKIHSKGTVIFPKIGGAIATNKRRILLKNSAIDNNCLGLTPYSGLRTDYLYLILSAVDLVKYQAGTSVPALSQSVLEQIITALPPEAEQPRIVAKVDELMALCDQLEQQTETSLSAHQTLVETLLNTLLNADQNSFDPAWKRIAQHFDVLFTTEHSIDQLKQTILQLAVMGKLVPKDPNDESASVLLEKIAAEKEQLIKNKVIKKQKPLPPISEDEKPFELPDGWEWCSLQSLITIMDAGWSPACPPEPSPSDDIWGVLKTTAVQSMEYREFENKVLAANKEPRSQYEVKVGDILITRAGPKNRVGVSCLVQNTRPKLMISDKIIRFHLVEMGMSERYLSLCLNAGATAEYLESTKSGMAESQMNISQDKLKSAPIPLAPNNEQFLIIKKVDELMALCDELKVRLQESQTTQLHLADAMAEQGLHYA